MAIKRKAPNGVIIKFPEGTSEETIKEYWKIEPLLMKIRYKVIT